jgi:hypothetical protein
MQLTPLNFVPFQAQSVFITKLQHYIPSFPVANLSRQQLRKRSSFVKLWGWTISANLMQLTHLFVRSVPTWISPPYCKERCRRSNVLLAQKSSCRCHAEIDVTEKVSKLHDICGTYSLFYFVCTPSTIWVSQRHRVVASGISRQKACMM